MVRGVARLSLAVALALLICAAQLVAAGRQQQPHSRSRPRTQSSMSSLQRRAVRLLQLTPPAPVDLGGAKKLHAELLQRLSTIRYVYGHAPSARPELAHLAAVRAPTTTALGEVEPACVAAFQSACGGVGSDRICDVCAGQNQHALRAAGCAPADVLLMCSGEDGPLITPVAFGADPTGATDSTAAFRSAVSAMLQRADGQLAAPIRDLGGVTLDLLGGKYTTDNPVAFPSNVGNFAVTQGSIAAASTFAPGRALLEVGTLACETTSPQGVCNEYVNLHNLFLDGGHVASGGIHVYNTMGVTIGPNAFIIGFVDAGIRVDGGHEAMISEVWVAQHFWNEPVNPSMLHGVGIEINGPDNILFNVIVFARTKVGIKVGWQPDEEQANATALNWPGCNLLSAVHVWNGGPSQVGLQLDGPRNRISDSYMDGGYLNITNPNAITVENTLFLNTHAVWHTEASWMPIKHVRFRDNTFNFHVPGPTTGNYNRTSIELHGPFNAAHSSDIVVEDAINTPDGQCPSCVVKATTARKTLPLHGVARVEFDFTRELLFPWIDDVIYSVSLDDASNSSAVTAHLARPAVGTTVVVELEKAGSGSVTMQVWQTPARGLQ